MRQRLTKAQAAGVKRRLFEVAETRGVSWRRFVAEAGFPQSTASDWRSSQNCSVPGVPALIQFAKRYGMSIDWLLLGEGPPIRGASAQRQDLAGDLRAEILARVVAPRGESPAARLMVGRVLPKGMELIEHLVGLVRERVVVLYGAKWWSDAGPALAERYLEERDPKVKKFLADSLASGTLSPLRDAQPAPLPEVISPEGQG